MSKRRIIVAAALLTGCTGQIGGAGQSTGPGAGPGTRSGVPAGSDPATSTPGVGSDPGSTGATPGATDPGSTGTAPGTTETGSTGTPATGDAATGSAANPVACVPGVPATSQLPRLTRVQYDNTIRDLVGLTSQPSTMLAPDSIASVDQRTWDGYQAAAESLAQEIMADPNARAMAIPCATADDACASQFIADFGQRAFRRPLTAEETQRFESIYANRATLTETGTFDEAAQVLIKSFLDSPSFLMRAEISEQPSGDYLALNGYEVASRLSYMLWGSMPDETLFAAAAANTLSTPEEILAQAQRMLADPKARTRVSQFHQEYAHMGPGTRWAEIQRDTTLYPAFTEAQVPLMSAETERFYDYVTFDRAGTFQDLVMLPVGFVNADLAPLYGLDPAAFGADLVPTDLDPATRAGAFTRVGFLTSYSLFDRKSPILRGAFLQKEVLCRAVGAPPADASSTPLPTDATLMTNRERVQAQTAGAQCAGCHHEIINPTGFALDSYDAVGSYQTTENNGVAIDTTATVQLNPTTTVDVTGPIDLMTAIANSPDAQSCYAKKWVEFAYERLINSADACLVDAMAGKLAQGGYTIVNLIADLTQSDSFRYRTVEVAP